MKGKLLRKLCAISLSALMVGGAGLAEVGSFAFAPDWLKSVRLPLHHCLSVRRKRPKPLRQAVLYTQLMRMVLSALPNSKALKPMSSFRARLTERE